MVLFLPFSLITVVQGEGVQFTSTIHYALVAYASACLTLGDYIILSTHEMSIQVHNNGLLRCWVCLNFNVVLPSPVFPP